MHLYAIYAFICNICNISAYIAYLTYVSYLAYIAYLAYISYCLYTTYILHILHIKCIFSIFSIFSIYMYIHQIFQIFPAAGAREIGRGLGSSRGVLALPSSCPWWDSIRMTSRMALAPCQSLGQTSMGSSWQRVVDPPSRKMKWILFVYSVSQKAWSP